MNLFSESLGVIAGVLGIFVFIPQMGRVIKHKSQVGVSLGTWLLILLSTVGWTVFGWRYFSWSQILTNWVSVVLALTLCYVLMRERYTFITRLLVLAGVVVPTALVVGFGPEWLMAITLCLPLLSRFPQAAESFHSWRRVRSTMVSLTTYWLSTASSTLWVVYGILTDRPVLVWFSLFIVLLNITIVLFEILAQRAFRERASGIPLG